MNFDFEYALTFKSSLDEVDIQVMNLLAILDEKFTAYNRFALDLVLRETLNNAVIHGNKRDPECSIQFSIKLKDNRFIIVAEDEGAGFDWRSALHRESVRGYDHGRGFPILQSYCSVIELNEKGNEIRLSLPFNKPPVA